MGELILAAVSLVVALPIFIIAVGLLYQFPVLGMGLILLSFLCEALAIHLRALLLDIVFAPLFVAGITGLVLRSKFTRVNLLWLLLGMLIFFSFIKGFLTYGYNAVLEVRPYFYFWTGTLYFMSFSYQAILNIKWTKWWLGAATALLFIAIIRWITDGLGITEWYKVVGVTQFRVLNASQALFLAETFGVLLFLGKLQRLPCWQILLPTFGLAILVLQHKTVWVAVFFLILLMFLRERETHGRLIILFLSLVVICCILTPILGEKVDQVVTSLSDSVSKVNDEHSTFAWRVEGWQFLLADLSFPLEYFIGKPFGAGYTRYLGNSLVEVAPHNYYIQTLLRVGLLGLLTLLLVYYIVLFSPNKYNYSNVKALQEKRTLWFLVMMQLVFLFPYAPNFEQSIILGLASSYAQTPVKKIALTKEYKTELEA